MKKKSLKTNSYDLISTQDNSLSFYSPRFDENAHSLSGAKSETLHNFIRGCEIHKRLEKWEGSQPFSILEVGFGLGYGLLESYQVAKNLKKKIHFTSFEIEPELVTLACEKQGLEQYFKIRRKSNFLLGGNEYFHFEILLGDARERLKKASFKPYQAIFQDAFSPKKNPGLWTWQWFQSLKNMASQDGLLSTYSASVSIRKSLLKAGWRVENKKGFSHKKSMTLAKLTGEIDHKTLLMLEKSSIKPLCDTSLFSGESDKSLEK